MRVLKGRKAEAYVRALEQRGATDLARVEKQVRTDCGGRSRKTEIAPYAGMPKNGMAVKPKQPLRVSDAELEQGWNTVSPEFKQALKTAAGKHTPILRMAKAAVVD